VAVFASKVAKFGIARAGVLAVAQNQPELTINDTQAEAAAEGVNLELYFGWNPFVRALFFWLRGDAADPVQYAHERIYKRLVELECSVKAQKAWLDWYAPS
jgi:hypothetical protein